MTRSIDLNADLGESDSPEGLAAEVAILEFVTSANIACGGHAGDARSMALMVEQAGRRGVAIGAHPAFPDKKNFGRKLIQMPADVLRDSLTAQIQALKDETARQGYRLHHIKPHGALYNAAADDADLARVICDVADTFKGTVLFGPPVSALEAEAEAREIPFIAEGFADRVYAAPGRLVPRSEPGAVLHDPEDQKHQALSLVLDGAVSGHTMRIETLCLHGDTPGALAAAAEMRRALVEAGLTVKAAGHG